MTLGDRIHYLRTSSGMTLQELSNKIGVGYSTIGKWERGYIKSLRTDKLENLAKALNTTVDYLMGLTDNSVNVGTNNGVIGSNSGGVHIESSVSKEEEELLRIFKSLNVRRRSKLLSLAFELEEESQ